MNLHLLPADDQLFVPNFVKTVADNAHAQNNLLMCYAQEMVVSAKEIPFAEPALVLSYINDKSVNRVIFHALQPEAYSLIKIIKKSAPGCRIDWIYWGETFDTPPSLMGNSTLNEYLKARGLPNWLSTLMVKINVAQQLLWIRTALLRHKTSKYIRTIDTMYHWSRADYEHIKNLLHCRHLNYQNFFYEGIDHKMGSNNLMARELECDPAECIVLGHSATMRNNHLDVLSAICAFAVSREKILVCPLSYGTGGKDYIDKIVKRLSETKGLMYRVCSKFYPREDYLCFLSKCGSYIAPGRGSIGAGNMLSYSLNGGVPITNHLNSTGGFLKSIGGEVAIYENTRDIVGLLDKYFGTHSQKNQIVVEETFSLKKKSKYYDALLAVY